MKATSHGLTTETFASGADRNAAAARPGRSPRANARSAHVSRSTFISIVGPLVVGQRLGGPIPRHEVDPKAGVGRKIADLAAPGSTTDFSNLAAIAAEHDDFVALFHRLHQLRQARLRLVHVDGDH